MNTSGDRLRGERIKLGLSQEAFAARGGVKKLAQINYEQGRRQPDAEYLRRIAEIGADVAYILTGQKLSAARETEGSPDCCASRVDGARQSLPQRPRR